RRARTARIGATASWRWTVFQANISGKFEGGVGGEGPDHGFQRKGANRMSGTVTLFRIRGIPVRVHLSWLVVFSLIAWSLAAGCSPSQLPTLSTPARRATIGAPASCRKVAALAAPTRRSRHARGRPWRRPPPRARDGPVRGPR